MPNLFKEIFPGNMLCNTILGKRDKFSIAEMEYIGKPCRYRKISGDTYRSLLTVTAPTGRCEGFVFGSAQLHIRITESILFYSSLSLMSY